MAVTRALTWLHLLPESASFDVAAGPDWLCQPLRALSQNDGNRIVVRYKAANSDVRSDAGFVGINSRVDDAALRQAGLNEIQRFAVLPNWDNPRWFIPLTSPAISSAGFNLYTPARTSARLKRALARALVYTRLPIWYRDQIVVAQRNRIALLEPMDRLFAGARLSIALSAGAPEGALNRKASAAVIDDRGEIRAFLKIAASPLATQLLHREVAVLNVLGMRGGNSALAPKLLWSGEIEGAFTLAQSPLPGGPAPAALAAEHQAYLDRLTAGSRMSPTQTELVRSLSDRINALKDHRTDLLAAFDDTLPTLSGQQMAHGVVHGDFAPWNLRRHAGQITAFDWEYGHLDGPAGLDEIHYQLQVGLEIHHWSAQRAFTELTATPLLDRYFSTPSVAARVALVTLYLVEILTRLFSEGYDRTNEMVQWNLELLGRLRNASPKKEAVLA
jgi:hypothetical protein